MIKRRIGDIFFIDSGGSAAGIRRSEDPAADTVRGVLIVMKRTDPRILQTGVWGLGRAGQTMRFQKQADLPETYLAAAGCDKDPERRKTAREAFPALRIREAIMGSAPAPSPWIRQSKRSGAPNGSAARRSTA